MRATVLVLIIGFVFSACTKDKYTSAPQIKYKSLTTNFYDNSSLSQAPGITFSVTDAEGDLGDTATIFIKNLFTGDSIELPFPDLAGATKSNFKADVTASVGRLGGCITANPPGHMDTMFYEIYIKDFGKNISNTIVTEDPVYQQCP